MLDPDRLARVPGVTGADPTHVLIETAPLGITGYTAIDWLREQRAIDVELADHRRFMPLVSFAHDEPQIRRLVAAIRDMADAHRESDDELPGFPPLPQMRTEAPMLPRDAFFAKTETVKFKGAAGRISAEFVTPYPPGIPLVAPGELYTQQSIDYLQAFIEAGGFVEGATDPELQTLRVVAQ